ncbi:flagellar alpha dynein [Microcoleus sp. herbarium12]|uniref:flagellar alpha dynein n=1 Tax=Microcoleus sp. herbarium12 TaxID=3055437 RepID=UPI002FD0EDA8
MKAANKQLAEWDKELNQLHERNGDLGLRVQMLEEELQKVRSQLATERASREEVETQLSDLRQKSVTASREFPEPADLFNQLKARRKKSGANLADMEAVLDILSYLEQQD